MRCAKARDPWAISNELLVGGVLRIRQRRVSAVTGGRHRRVGRWSSPEIWLLLLATTQLLSCTPDREPMVRPNILVVVVDTLRLDRLGSYGHGGNLSPFIDKLASRSTLFENAYAQASWTNPSVASLLTSRYQSQHRVISFGSHLPEAEITLAEVLAEHGYVTGGFNANLLVHPTLGFGQGFDYYKTYARKNENLQGALKLIKARAERINREALSWLDGLSADKAHRRPVFLYLQYMEPHAPYDPPEIALRHVFGDRPRPDIERVNEAMLLPGTKYDAEMLREAELLYDAEIFDLDKYLSDIFDALRARGFLDDAIVVFTSDHGEEFSEHGLVGHHQTLYEEVIRVPLLVNRSPVQLVGKRVSSVVSLTDVAPTLLKLAGVPVPSSFEGRSLVEFLSSAETADKSPASTARRWSSGRGARPAFSELIKEPGTLRLSPHERAVVVDGAKLIVGVDAQRQYFDLRADPLERNPDAALVDLRARVDAGEMQLQSYAGDTPTRDGKKDLSSETVERMRALGYVE